MDPTDPLVHPPDGPYGYPVYGHPMHRAMQPPTAAPPQSWQAPNAIAPQQTHMPSQPPILARSYRAGPWVGFDQPMDGSASPAAFDYRFRNDHSEWPPPPGDFPYDPTSVLLGC